MSSDDFPKRLHLWLRGISRWVAVLVVFVAPARVESARPNIVVIVADDLGAGDLGYFGHPEIQTPNLDRLAQSGLLLERCYTASPICSPARAGLLTGRNPNRSGVYTAISMMSPMHLRTHEVTVSTLLKQSGYTTALMGKWHLNGIFNLPGQPQPDDHGFEYWFALQNIALPNHLNPYNFVRNGIPMGPMTGYAAGIVADETVAWLRKARDKARPFFLYVAFAEPHEPIMTAPQFRAPYEANYPDDPSRVAYYGNVTQLDHAVGRILDALKSEGVENETLVWFTSDNGPARTKWHNVGSTGGLREYKQHLYEGGIRVPGILSWPGRISPGSRSSEPVSGLDVLPTVCAVAGVAEPKDRIIDGTDLTSLFSGQPLRRQRPLYWQFLWALSAPQVALVQGKWKVVGSIQGARGSRGARFTEEDVARIQTGKPTVFALYDLEADPAETRDVSGENPDVYSSLTEQLIRSHADVGAEAPGWPAFTNTMYDSKRVAWPDYVAKPLRKETAVEK